jgi:TPR repeat protein
MHETKKYLGVSQKMKKILLVMFMVLFTAAAGFCGEFENTLKKAERGDVEAQYILGLRYYEGEKYDSQSNIDFSFLEDPRWKSLMTAPGQR